MKFFLIAILAVGLSGCASHSMKYTPPSDVQGSTSITVDKSFKAVWETLVEKLAGESFIIDSVNKDSGLIVASKKLNPPSKFADCGYWNGHFKNLRADDTYNFNGAESANYMVANGDTFTAIRRSTALSSKSNIFVKKLSDRKTSVSVTAQYTLSVDSDRKTWVYPGDVYTKSFHKVEWNSNERGQIDQGAQTQCVTNFSLEQTLLGLVK